MHYPYSLSTCAQLTTRAPELNLNNQQGNPLTLTGQSGPREQSRHGRRRRRKESEVLRGQEERKGEAVESVKVNNK